MCSNNIVVSRMEGRHGGISLEDIQKEQDSIDRLINNLISSDPTALFSESSSDINKETTISRTSTPTQAKRGRGRPPKQPSLSSRPNIGSASPVQRSRINNPSLENILDCIAKLNQQNKNLLQYVQSLSNNVEKHQSDCKASSSAENTNEIEENSVVSAAISNRLEKIEQSINSNILVCNGPGIPDLINEVKADSSINLERLKGNLCTAICGEEVTEIDIRNLRVSLFGREKKSLKIECASTSSKVHIVKQARKKRPSGIYVSEFLTKPKLQVLRNLKGLKKLHPSKIKSVFTKEGNIFYILQGSSRPVMVKSNSEIENIVKEPSTTDNSNSSESTVNNPLVSTGQTYAETVGGPSGAPNTSSLAETSAAVDNSDRG